MESYSSKVHDQCKGWPQSWLNHWKTSEFWPHVFTWEGREGGPGVPENPILEVKSLLRLLFCHERKIKCGSIFFQVRRINPYFDVRDHICLRELVLPAYLAENIFFSFNYENDFPCSWDSL